MNIIIPTLEDVFDIGHTEGSRESLNKIMTLLQDGCDVSFIKAYIKMELTFLDKPNLKGALRHGNSNRLLSSGLGVRNHAPDQRNPEEGDS